MATFVQDGWSKALEEQSPRLARKKYSGLIQQLDYESFETSILETLSRYSRGSIARHVRELKPTLEHLNSFSNPITTIAQASPKVVGFAWGSIQVVIMVAIKFAEIMDIVTKMIENITRSITHAIQYTKMFPNSWPLQNCVHCLIKDCVGFCITALKFFKRRPLYNLLRLFWSAVDRKFKTAQDDINSRIKEFEGELQIIVCGEIVEIHRRLDAAIPEVRITQPDTLYDVPYLKNNKFYGRDDSLANLHKQLINPCSISPPRQGVSVIHGIGGVGKTQVAIEYTYRYRDSYDYIFWIRAETDPELTDGMAAISRRLCLPPANMGNKGAVEMVRTWFETTKKRWLLVFDNAEDRKSLELYWPRAAHGSVLVTSQNAQFARAMGSEILLKPFDRSEGSKFFLSHFYEDQSQTQSEDAKSISYELGGLPLAIAHVAGYIGETKVSTKHFLEMLPERRYSAPIFADKRIMSTSDYGKTLDMVWDIALKRLAGLDPNAFKLIQVLSMMNPDGVPEDILCGDHHEPALSFLTASDRMQFPGMIRNLSRQQLVDKEEITGKPCFLMHRSLQRSILHRLDNNFSELQNIFDITFTLLRKVFPKQSPVQFPQNDLWTVCEQYSAHVMNLRTVYVKSVKRPAVSIEFAEMLADVANYFWERNYFNDGLLASDTAENICETLEGPFLNQRANVHTLAAALRSNCGISQRAECLQRFRKSVALRQQYIDQLDACDATMEDLYLYSNAWSDFGGVLLDYEFYEDSLPYFDLAIAIKNRLGDPMAGLDSMKFKALALAALGRFEEAIQLIPEDSLVIEAQEGLLCSESVFAALLAFRFSWATIFLNAGRVDDARAKMLEILAIRKNLFGQSGRGTLDAYYMMAVIEQRRGEFAKAESYLRDAVDRSGEWAIEALTRGQYRLGQILHLLDRHDEAREYQKKAQATRNKLCNDWAKYLPKVNNLDDDAIYDHIVSMEAGRSTLEKGLLGITPKMNEICRLLKERVLATSDAVTPSELAPLLRLGDISILTKWKSGSDA